MLPCSFTKCIATYKIHTSVNFSNKHNQLDLHPWRHVQKDLQLNILYNSSRQHRSPRYHTPNFEHCDVCADTKVLTPIEAGSRRCPLQYLSTGCYSDEVFCGHGSQGVRCAERHQHARRYSSLHTRTTAQSILFQDTYVNVVKFTKASVLVSQLVFSWRCLWETGCQIPLTAIVCISWFIPSSIFLWIQAMGS